MEGSLRSAHAKTAQLQDLWQRSHLSGVAAASMQMTPWGNLGNAVQSSQDHGLGLLSLAPKSQWAFCEFLSECFSLLTLFKSTWSLSTTSHSFTQRKQSLKHSLVDHPATLVLLPSYHASSRTMVSSPSRFVTLYPSRLCGWRTDQRSPSCLRSLSPPPRVLRSPTVSLAVRNASIVAGSFARPSFSLCSSPSISPPMSLPRYGMVGTVAGDGAPRSLSDFRSLGVCWTRPFTFFDSSLDGLRPFLLLLFHPALPFFSLALRYWLTLLLHSPLFHISHFLTEHNWHYSRLVGLFSTSLLLVPHNSHITPSC